MFLILEKCIHFIEGFVRIAIFFIEIEVIRLTLIGFKKLNI